MEQNNTPVVTSETPAPVETKELSKRAKFRAQKVLLLAAENPKKKGSESHRRFEDYFTLKGTETVDEILRNTNIRMDDITHDSAHGFIAVGDEAIEKAKNMVAAREAKAIEDAKALLAKIQGPAAPEPKVEAPVEETATKSKK
jgi:hypothetical protein